MSEPKYNLTPTTEAENNEFMKDFHDLLEKHSLYFEPVPKFTRKSLVSPWEVTCQIFLQKKTLSAVDVPVNESIPSPFTDETDTTTA